MSSLKNIVVVGATGNIGEAIINALLEKKVNDDACINDHSNEFFY